MEKANRQQYLIYFGAVLIAAVLLRVIPLGDTPFFNDELSALSRLDYDSFGTLVEQGIKPDGHPAGVQAFLFVWEKLVGFDEFMLRLPFVLFSIGAVVLFFLVVKNFFHPTAAVLASAFFACIQYSLYYGIQIRPYAPGQFFVLLMAWALQQIWLRGSERLDIHWWTFLLAGVGTAYIHYFAGLQALVIGLLALLFLPRNQKKLMLFAALGGILLYLPHVSIFLAQIEKGGIGGWLAPPDLYFFRDYLSYILHHSWKFGLFILFFIFLAISMKGRLEASKRKFRRFAAFAFLLPMAIGFVYSRAVNPVLHEGSAYFAFPFLVVFAASLIPPLALRYVRLWTLATLLLAIGTLTLERSHFAVSHSRGMEQVIEDHQSWQEQEDAPLLLRANDSAYFAFYEASEPFAFLEVPKSYIGFRMELEQTDASRLGLGWVSKPLDLEYVAIAREFFPYIKLKREYFVSEYFGLGTEAAGKGSINAWKSFRVNMAEARSPTLPFYLGRKEVLNILDYSPAITLELDSLGENWNQWQYWASAEYYSKKRTEAKLVLSFQIGDSVLHQEHMPLAKFDSNPTTWNWCHKVLRAKHGPFKQQMPENVQLKVYVWSPGAENLKLSDLKLEIWKGNPRLYGLFEPLVDP